MSPVDLSDGDFELDAPPGFRSLAKKQMLQATAAITCIVGFLLQMVLPQIIMFSQMPGFGRNQGVLATQPQIPHAFLWEDQLWVPMTEIGFGNTRVSLREGTWDGAWAKDSDLTLQGAADGYVSDGETLWCVANSGGVTQIQGRNTTTFYPRRRLLGPSLPFVRDGVLSLFDRQADGSWLLLELRENQWVIAGELRLPPEFASEGALPASGWPPVSERVQVVAFGEEFWTLCGDGTSLWRCAGIPSGPTAAGNAEGTPISALAWSNQGSWDWESCRWDVSEWQAAANGETMVVVETAMFGGSGMTTGPLVWSRDGSTRHEKLPMLAGNGGQGVVATAAGKLVVLTESFPPGGVRLFEWTGSGFLEGQRLPGSSTPMAFTAENWPLYAVLWLLPVAITTIVLVILAVTMRACRDPRYTFGHFTVRLAGLGRRSLARVIDMLIFASPSMVVSTYLMFTVNWETWLETAMADPVATFKVVGIWMLLFLGYWLFVLVLLAWMEGIWGQSPGKWLCGIRVVRTTLEPIGIIRAFARSLLLMIDSMFNYLVGIVMIALLAKQQRLGDLVADSIVADAATVPTREELRAQ